MDLQAVVSGTQENRVEALRQILGYPIKQRDPGGSRFWFLRPGADADEAADSCPIAVGFYSELAGQTHDEIKQFLTADQQQREIYGHYTGRIIPNQPMMYLLLPETSLTPSPSPRASEGSQRETDFNREDAWECLPETNPFLKRLFKDVSQQPIAQLGEELADGIAEAVSILRAAKMDAILEDFRANRRLTWMLSRQIVIQTLVNHQEQLKRFAVRTLLLFGSVVRDKAHAESDVDLLVEFEKPVGLFTFRSCFKISPDTLSGKLFRIIF